MKTLASIARVLLGLIFLFFGLNGLLQFLPVPAIPPGFERDYFTVMAASHYLTIIAVIQILCGILFLANRWVPLALVVIAGVIANILFFHILMNPSGIVPGIVVTILWIIVARRYRWAIGRLFEKGPLPEEADVGGGLAPKG